MDLFVLSYALVILLFTVITSSFNLHCESTIVSVIQNNSDHTAAIVIIISEYSAFILSNSTK